MPLPRRRRIAAALFAAVLADVGVVALIAGGPASAAAPGPTAPASVSQANATSVAKLVILKPGASIRRKGKTVFKPAKDGAKLRVGDTIQTDGTGFVEIRYTDSSFTRLDVSTTFTIISLTDDQGNRKIDGSLDSGRAWNRTSALTESESFQQEGAGATAAVVGTAYSFQCDGAGHCIIMSMVDGVKFTSVDGEVKNLKPLEECDATELSASDTNLCVDPTPVTADQLDAWLGLNIFLDELEGFPGPVFGTIDNGVVTSFTPGTPPTETTPPAAPVIQAPVIDPTNAISCDGGCADLPSTLALEPGNNILIEDEEAVDFVVNIANPSGLPLWVVFTKLPDGAVGIVYIDTTPVVTNTRYAAATTFMFDPAEYEVGDNGAPIPPGTDLNGPNGEASQSDTMVFHAENAASASPSDPTQASSSDATVTATVYEDPCEGSCGD